jgi:hypothetical protein
MMGSIGAAMSFVRVQAEPSWFVREAAQRGRSTNAEVDDQLPLLFLFLLTLMTSRSLHNCML